MSFSRYPCYCEIISKYEELDSFKIDFSCYNVIMRVNGTFYSILNHIKCNIKFWLSNIIVLLMDMMLLVKLFQLFFKCFINF